MLLPGPLMVSALPEGLTMLMAVPDETLLATVTAFESVTVAALILVFPPLRLRVVPPVLDCAKVTPYPDVGVM